MRIADIITRLIAAAPDLTAVLPIEEIEALDRGPAPRSGTVFVLPAGERADPDPHIAGAFRQHVTVMFMTALVIRRHDDARGGDRITEFDGFKAAIEQALAGWQASPANGPVQLVQSRAIPRKNGVTIFVMTWSTTRYLEAGQ